MYPVKITNYYGHIFETPVTAIMKEIRIDELFELVKVKGFNTTDLNEGPYPLIMSGSNNNGIQRYVDRWCLDTEEIGTNVITATYTGSVGYCFVQHGKFCLSDAHPNVLKPINKIISPCLGFIAFVMTQKFTKIYSYSTKLNNARLMNETIELPVVVRGLSETELNDLMNDIVTIDELTSNGTSSKYTYEINENLINNYIYTNLM